MSDYYNPQRTRNLYDPASKEPFRLSRSKIDLFLECARCFYLDRRLGVGGQGSLAGIQEITTCWEDADFLN